VLVPALIIGLSGTIILWGMILVFDNPVVLTLAFAAILGSWGTWALRMVV